MLAIIENICDFRITFLYLNIWHIHLKKEMWNDWECFTIILGTQLNKPTSEQVLQSIDQGIDFYPITLGQWSNYDFRIRNYEKFGSYCKIIA